MDIIQRSEHVSALTAALAVAQGEFPPIPKDRTVTVKPKDPSKRPYTFAYATFDCCVRNTRPALAANGLSVTFQAMDGMMVCYLRHGDEFLASWLPVQPPGSNWQEFGSAITYAKRYLYCSMLGIAADDDDDVNGADGNEVVDRKDAPKPPLDQLADLLNKQGVTNMALWCEETLGMNIPTSDKLTDVQVKKLLDVARGVEERKPRPKATAAHIQELAAALKAIGIADAKQLAAWVAKHAKGRKVTQIRDLFDDEVPDILDTAKTQLNQSTKE